MVNELVGLLLGSFALSSDSLSSTRGGRAGGGELVMPRGHVTAADEQRAGHRAACGGSVCL